MKIDTILCGNARDLVRDIPDNSIDLVLTDPPFGIGFNYDTEYKDNPKVYPDMLRWIIDESTRVVRPGGLCFVFVAQPRLRDVLPMFPDTSRIFSCCKNFVQIRQIAVQYAYDPVVFWQKEGKPLKEYSGRDWFVANTSPSSFTGPNKAKFHACPRPLDAIMYMVDNFCPVGGLVGDFFMGSGTTAVAAKITGRHWWGCEVVPELVQQANCRVSDIPDPLRLDIESVSQMVMEGVNE